MSTPNIEELRETVRRAHTAIDKIESAKRRAEHSELVGQCFRTRNNYSCPEKPSDYWWLYAEVLSMDGHGHLKVRQFQVDKYGRVEIEPERHAYHMNDWTPIPRATFVKAQKAVLAKITKLLKS